MTAQLLVNALIATSIYTLAGVSFALLFRINRFFDFAFALSYTVGAYAAFAATAWLKSPLFMSVAAAMAAAGGTAWAIDSTVYSKLRKRRAPTLVLFLASIGIYVVGQNVLSLGFGDAARSIRPYDVSTGFEIAGARISPPQLWIVAAALTATLATAALLAATQRGRQIRAVGADIELARIVGVPVPTIISMTSAAAGALGGLAGMLVALDRDIVPTMGMNLLLVGIVAMIVGGHDRILGVALGAALIALAQNLSILWISSVWQEAIVFCILVAFLLARPQGFTGTTLRRATG